MKGAQNRETLRGSLFSGRFHIRASLQVHICRNALELRAPPGSSGDGSSQLLEKSLTQQTSLPALLFSSPRPPQ